MYIDSQNIDVFPFHDNRQNHNNRVLTEQNLIKLAKHSLENESFVISDSYAGPDILFEFMLCGYHFSIKFDAKTVLNNKDTGTITAVAYLNKETGTLFGSDALFGSDNNETKTMKFTALQLVSQDQTPTNPASDSTVTDANFKEMSLDILTIPKKDTYVIPEESRRTIDGGVIE